MVALSNRDPSVMLEVSSVMRSDPVVMKREKRIRESSETCVILPDCRDPRQPLE